MKTKRRFKVKRSKLTEMGYYFTKLDSISTAKQGCPMDSIYESSEEIYYAVTDTELTEGSEITLDLNEYEIIEHPHTVVYEDTCEVIEVIYKYLWPKEAEWY